MATRQGMRDDDRFGRRMFAGLLILLLASTGTLIATWATIVSSVSHIAEDVEDIKKTLHQHEWQYEIKKNGDKDEEQKTKGE